MELNITQTTDSYQFENRENLRNTAKNLLNKKGGSKESIENIIEKTVFEARKLQDSYQSPQLAIIKASSQISMNNSLKETLKYLRSNHVKKQTKTPVLGELWDIVNSSGEENSYTGELYDFEIDSSIKNIFAA